MGPASVQWPLLDELAWTKSPWLTALSNVQLTAPDNATETLRPEVAEDVATPTTPVKLPAELFVVRAD